MRKGEYKELVSKIPNYSKQFLYHLYLDPGKQFSIAIENGVEFAVFLPLQNAIINDDEFTAGEFIRV